MVIFDLYASLLYLQSLNRKNQNLIKFDINWDLK